MNDNHTHTRNLSPPQAVAHNFNELRHDLLTLLQLQWELLGADVQQSAKRLRLPAVLMAVAGALVLATVATLMLAMAAGFAAWGVPLPLALLLAALLGLAIAGGLLWFAWRRFQLAGGVLTRSREELHRNLETFQKLFSSGVAFQRGGPPADSPHPN